MALKPFDGELDKAPSGLVPFSGALDGEDTGPASKAKGVASDLGLALNIGSTVDIPQQAIGLGEIAARSPTGEMLGLAFPGAKRFAQAVEVGLVNPARDFLEQRSKKLLAETTPEQQASNKKTFLGDEATWENLTRDGLLAAPGKLIDLARDGKLAGEGLTDPRKIAFSAVESMPGTVLTMGPTAKIAGAAGKAAFGETMAATGSQELAKAAAVKAAERSAMIAGGLGEGAQGAGSAYEQTRQKVMDLPLEKLQESPFFQEQLKANGGDVDAARTAAANEAAKSSASGAFVVDALLGGVGDKFIGSAVAGKGSRTGSVARGVGRELPTEMAQSGGEQFSENLGIQTFADPTQSLAQDVGEQAIGGGLSGGLMGGVMGGAMHRSQAPQQELLPDTGPISRAANVSIADGAARGGLPHQATPAEDLLGQAAMPQGGEQNVSGSVLDTTTQPVSLSAPDRVQEIAAEAASLEGRAQVLDAPDSGYGPAFDPERADIAARLADLNQERQSITGAWPQATPGAKTSFSTENGQRIQANYALMEAGDLNTSHDEQLRPSKAYPQELQPRERNRAASETQIASIAQRLDPARLGESADAATGAPIVGPDGLVESGNARSIALKRVYRSGGEQAEGYKAYLRDNAARFGITSESVDTLQNPVLVRVRETPVNRAEFARQANSSTVAQMSSSEQAKADAARLSHLDDLTPTEDGDFITSRGFIRRFVAGLPETERAGMVDANGQLSQGGYARIRNAVLAKAYGDSPVLPRMVESLDDSLRNIGKALMTAAPAVAKMRQDVNEGVLHQADITPAVMAAVEDLSRLKDSGRSVREHLAQQGMFAEGAHPETADLLAFLDENIRRPRKIAEFIQRYTEALRAAGNPNQGSLLGEATAPAKGDLIAAAKGREYGNAGPTDGQANPGENQVIPGSGKQAQQQPASQSGGGSGAGGDEVAGGSAKPSAGESRSEWVSFPKETGTLGIPRAEMPQIKGDSKPALFSRQTGVLAAPPLTKHELDAIAAGIDVGTKFKIETRPFAALPQAVRDEADKQGYQSHEVKAVFHDGTVYLVEGSITSAAEAEEAVFHELYHRWLRGYLKGRELDSFNRIFDGIGGGPALMKLAAKYGWKDARGVIESYLRRKDMSKAQKLAIITEELLVHLGQRNANPGLVWKLREFIGAFRQWLRERGWVRLAELGENDLAALLKRARESDGVPGEGRPAFMFAGMNAKTADKFALANALERLDAGENAETVRQETGWFFGPDGKARFEINDREARLKVPATGKAGQAIEKTTVGALLNHPKLFAAYPGLANIEVATKAGTGASFTPAHDGQAELIRIGEDVGMGDVPSVLLHELQHAVQRIESFATGSNLLTAGSRDAYFRSAGEVEARNVQTRQKMTDEERSGLAPSWTTDVADQDVIVSWNGQEMANVPSLSNAQRSGMALRDVQAVADRVANGMKNLPRVHVLESPAALSTRDPVQKALRDYIRAQGAWEDAEGATHDGEIYLFASGLADEARAEHVLAVHEVTHYGLRGSVGADLDAALQAVWTLNAKVRKAVAELKARTGIKSNVAATEEVLADMRTEDLAKLSGWRRVVKAVRDWFSSIGAKALAARLDKIMKAGLDDQAKADLLVADLVSAAREWVRSGRRSGGGVIAGTALAGGSQASGIAARTTGFDKASGTVVADFKNDQPLKAHPDYKAAKAGDVASAVRLVQALVKSESIQAANDTFGEDVIYVPVHAEEASGKNQIPNMLALHYASQTGAAVDDDIIQTNRAFHTGANAMERLLARAEFGGKIERGRRYVLVDDVTTMGSTLADLAGYIRAQGGEVSGSVVLVNAMRGGTMVPVSKTINELEARHGYEIQKLFGIKPGALTASEAQYLLGFRTTYDLRSRVAKAGQERLARLRAKGLLPERQDSPGSVEPRLSRAVGAGTTSTAPLTAAQRAEAIIAQPAATWRPIDTIMRTMTQAARMDRLTTSIYNKAAQIIDRYTPEQVKAGVVSDYGVPEAVLDQRTLMQGRMRVQLRKTGALLDKLSTLTRAESRVAYEWMNNADPQAAAYFEAQLPPDSVKVMEEVKAMVDGLSKEAVALGQLDPEAFKRNRFEYLRRSYVKHTLDLTKGEAASRQRAIAVLGDQYKGRGMTDAVDMAKFKAVAPEWWGRKLKDGQADKGLKGEKFIRLERRQAVGQGVDTLPGVSPGGTKAKLLEVAYWPAGEALPIKYSTWDQAGTWQVVDTKGGKLVVWRDFTKAERVTMGEIDEARFAIAKTLHGMIHDVEVGRYLDWVATRHAKKAGEAINGEIVEASDRMRDTFKPGTWVQVPDTKIPGTRVLKYGKLAGRFVPGPIWNDIRQTVGFRFKPLGETYAAILGAWKTAKALALDTPIPTPDGWTTMGEIRVGDAVFDENGNVCVVMGATEVQHDRKCYEVAFSDGTKIVADAEHRWFTIRQGHAGVRTTDEIRATLKERTRGDANHKIPVAAALNLPDADLPIPPYALGAWLGDGDTRSARLSIGGDDVNEMVASLEKSGVRCGIPKKDNRNNVYTVRIKRGHDGCCRGHDKSELGEKGCRICNNERRRLKRVGAPYPEAANQHIQTTMRNIGLLGNKHIPAEYLRASEAQRRALLHGLMDTDGTADKRGMCAFITTLPALRDGVIELVRSLGYKPTLRSIEPQCNGKKGKAAWRISFKSYSDKPAFSLNRKKARLTGLPARPQRSQTRQIVSITPVKSVPVRCIAVSSKSRLYLAGAGMVPTHNTALSPAVHTNNVMANLVMADWHDVTAGHVLKALRVILGASQRDGKGVIGRAGNAASRAGTGDTEAAREIINRFNDSGASLGTWASKELQQEQLEPLLAALEKEVGIAGQTSSGQIGVMVALQKALQLRFPSAWDAFKPTKAGQAVRTEARSMLDLYEAEDQVFRLAAWLKAKEDGASDADAGKAARRSFLDYHINAPWIQAMRSTAFPFISFTYRSVPMLLEVAAKKPHKLMKLALLAAAVNALGYAIGGGDEDEDRRLLPEEKAGSIWGLVPKLIRMPWNSDLIQDGKKVGESPVFLDIRRFIPVGDIFDVGQTHSALPLLPFSVPGGPLAILSELAANKSQFTGKAITLETDTPVEKAIKVADHLYKAFVPNLPFLPGTYAWTGISNAATGKTDAFGREQSTAQAVASAVGIKLGSYPADVLRNAAVRETWAKIMEIDGQIGAINREYQRNGLDDKEFADKVNAQVAKKVKLKEDLQKRLGGG